MPGRWLESAEVTRGMIPPPGRCLPAVHGLAQRGISRASRR